MVSVTDIITYIGVPLAVLGVIPLIWNFTLSLLIWRRARKSLPKVALRFFHFRLDPVNGKVHGSFNRARFEIKDVVDKDAPISKLRTQLQVVQSHTVASTWMSFLATPMRITTISERYTKDFELAYATSAPLLALECDWVSFVYLALSIGVSPYDNHLQEIKSLSSAHKPIPTSLTLQSTTVEEAEGLLKVSINEGCPVVEIRPGTISFDLRRMFAWNWVMLVNDGKKWVALPLLEPKTFPVSRNVLPPLPTDVHSLHEIQDTKLLETSLTWVIYCEDDLHSAENLQKDPIPTPQAVLKAKQVALEDLQRLPQTDKLEVLLEPCTPDFRAIVKRSIEIGHADDAGNFWGSLNALPSMETLRATYEPLARTREKIPELKIDDLATEVGILARIIIAFSTACTPQRYRWYADTRRWKKEEWESNMDNLTGIISKVTPPNPLSILLENIDCLPPSKVYFA